LDSIAEKYGYIFKDNEKAEYTTLVAATCNAMQFVAEMDGTYCQILCYNLAYTIIDYQPEPDLNLAPRHNMLVDTFDC
jgi:amidase